MTTARQQLDLALLDMAQAGERPRCSEPGDIDLWTSDVLDERARAARLCQGCAVFSECGAAADEQDETWGVWAGVDRSPHRQTTNRRTA